MRNLFNPSTRKLHRLPVEPIGFSESHITREFVFYGLGYDSVSDDFKVVRFLQSNIKSGEDYFGHPFEIKVFSLKKNSWKSLHLPFEDYYKILEVDYDATEDLIRLNYRKLALKWHPDKHKGDSAATEKFQEINEAYNDVWILKEYEDIKSWSKMFTVPKPESVESFDFVRPLLYSKDRSKILLEINNAKNLMWFDLETKILTALGIECDTSFTADILVSRSSLVLGCKGDPSEAQRRKRSDDAEEE